jgi:hypothetical protein
VQKVKHRGARQTWSNDCEREEEGKEKKEEKEEGGL